MALNIMDFVFQYDVKNLVPVLHEGKTYYIPKYLLEKTCCTEENSLMVHCNDGDLRCKKEILFASSMWAKTRYYSLGFQESGLSEMTLDFTQKELGLLLSEGFFQDIFDLAFLQKLDYYRFEEALKYVEKHLQELLFAMIQREREEEECVGVLQFFPSYDPNILWKYFLKLKMKPRELFRTIGVLLRSLQKTSFEHEFQTMVSKNIRLSRNIRVSRFSNIGMLLYQLYRIHPENFDSTAQYTLHLLLNDLDLCERILLDTSVKDIRDALKKKLAKKVVSKISPQEDCEEYQTKIYEILDTMDYKPYCLYYCGGCDAFHRKVKKCPLRRKSYFSRNFEILRIPEGISENL